MDINPIKITKSLNVRKDSAIPWNRSTSTSDFPYMISALIEKTMVIATNKIVREKPIFTNLFNLFILKR